MLRTFNPLAARRLSFPAACCLAFLLPAGVAFGQAATPQPGEASTAGVPSIQKQLASSPWYDAETKQIKPVRVEIPTADSINRKSRWLPKPKTVKTSVSTNTATGGTTASTSSGLFNSSVTFGHLMAWALVIVIALLIIGSVLYMMSRSERSQRTGGGHDGDEGELPDEQLLERIKHLPAELRRTDVNLRTECERLMKEGQYDQAIILLLGHQLLILDQAGYLRLNRGKTNGRYVRESGRQDAAVGQWLKQTSQAFEASYFGRHTLADDLFTRLWLQNRELESSVAEKEAMA